MRFTVREVRTPKATFWVVDGPVAPGLPVRWGTALSEAEAESVVERLEAAYRLGAAAGHRDGLSEGRTEAAMLSG